MGFGGASLIPGARQREHRVRALRRGCKAEDLHPTSRLREPKPWAVAGPWSDSGGLKHTGPREVGHPHNSQERCSQEALSQGVRVCNTPC